MEAPGICSASGGDGGGAEKWKAEELPPLVDPFLVEALGNPRHRLTVLRMELDIQRFMQNNDQHQFEFQHFPTSYLRCAAHRVAHYYGLQTISLDSIGGGPGNRIIVRKTLESRFPHVCLSEIPMKQSKNEKIEQVKVAICQRPKRTSSSDTNGMEIKRSSSRTVEEREEEYERARARIFSGSSGSEPEVPSSAAPADGGSLSSGGDEQECLRIVAEENEKVAMKDGVNRVAIFRDKEKDRNDPDYDRSYDRYTRGLVPSQSFSLEKGCGLQPPLFQYEAGYSQLGPLLRAQTSVSYRTSNTTLDPFGAFGCHKTSRDAVYMQWPNPAMVYVHSHEHFRHAASQAPFYQQPLSFEHSQFH